VAGLKHTVEQELLRRTYQYGRPHRGRFILLLTIIALSAGISLLHPVFLGGSMDAIIAKELRHAYWFLAGMLACTLLQGVVGLGDTYMTARISTEIAWRVKADLYQRMVTFTVPVHDRLRQGEMLSRIDGDAGAVGGLILTRLRLIPTIARACIILAVVLRLSLMLTGIQLLVLPLMYLASSHFGHILRRAIAHNRHLMDGYMSFLQESVAGIREIKALQLESRRVDGFEGHSRELRLASLSIALKNGYAGLTNMLIGGLGNVAVIAFAAWQIVIGNLTVGQLVLFTSYGGQLAGALQSITSFRRMREEQLASLERAFTLMDEPSEGRTVSTRPSPVHRASGELVLEDVGFGYKEGERVLHGFSCRFRPGALTGVAGLSGSGKTTLFNLLCRFYVPSEGTIHLDGRDIQHLDLQLVRRCISVVSQDPFFFRDTVWENLRYANLRATKAEILDCCRVAGVGSFIESLPQGYETVLRDRGTGLSGGQRQRLALARALLRGSRILLCDEITSSLDAEAEASVRQTLKHLAEAEGRTVVLVAHRASTMRHADSIVVLHRGAVVQQGTYEHLSQHSTLFRRLYVQGVPGAAG